MSFWSTNSVDNELRDALTKLEHLESTIYIKSSAFEAGLINLHSGKVEMLDWVLADNPRWELEMSFVEKTQDDELETRVFAGEDMASLTVKLTRISSEDPLNLLSLFYDRYGFGTNKAKPACVKYIRKWVRERSLIEVRAVKTQNEATARAKADELNALKRKYL